MLACHFVHNRSIATFHCGYWSHWEIINWRVWANNTVLVEWRGSAILSACQYWWHWLGHCWILKLWFSTFDRIIVSEPVGWYPYLHIPFTSLLFSEFIDIYCIAIKLSCWSYTIIGWNPLIRWLIRWLKVVLFYVSKYSIRPSFCYIYVNTTRVAKFSNRTNFIPELSTWLFIGTPHKPIV